MTPHDHKVACRNADYDWIVRSLLFPSIISEDGFSTIYDTSHLFFLGDLNYRLVLPTAHPHYSSSRGPEFSEVLSSEKIREDLKEYDQLTVEKRKGNVFVGLHEGEFWKFKCSYKYQLGHVDKYRWAKEFYPQQILILVFFSSRRMPSWTDRVLYATYSDSPGNGAHSNITNVLYTSILSYITSDHVIFRSYTLRSFLILTLETYRVPPFNAAACS